MKLFNSFYSKIFDRHTTALITFCLIYILINDSFEKYLTDILVVPLLSSVKSELYVDVIIVLLAIVVIVDFYRKYSHHKITTFKGLFPLLILTTFVGYYRVVNDTWQFTSFAFLPEAKYLDILFVFCFLQAIIFFRSVLSPGRKGQIKENTDSFIEDNPLSTDGIDLLHHEDYAKKIAGKIDSTNFSKSFAIGINGKWGSGKTTFMTLIERNLTLDKNIVVYFNPWKSETSSAIIIDFFAKFENALSERHTNLRKTVHSYSKVLLQSSGDTVVKILNSLFLSEKKSLDQLHTDIDEAIREIGKKIIIFVDDVDRLDKKEILEVLKLVRNTANFFNTVFVVAYDRDYVINAIEDFNDFNKEFFLEKIFQFELNLPQIQPETIQNKLEAIFKDYLKPTYYNQFKNLLDENLFARKKFIPHYLHTLRDVIRFSNGIITHLSLLDEEIVFSDLFLIELLRFKYPSCYFLIYTRDQFLTTENTFDKRYRLQKSELEKYLNENSSYLSIPIGDIPRITELLEGIFDDNFFVENHLSIVYPDRFNSYFVYRLLKGNLSNKDFLNFYKKSLNELKSKIDEWVEEGLQFPLRIRFEKIRRFENTSEFEKFFKAIFYLGSKANKDKFLPYRIVGYDHYDLLSKLVNRENKLAEYFYDGDTQRLKEFILDLFYSAKTPFIFESNIAHQIATELNGNSLLADEDELPIEENELGHILCYYLKCYIEENHPIDDFNLWELLRCCCYSVKIDTLFKYKNPFIKGAESAKLLIQALVLENIDTYLEMIVAVKNNKKRIVYEYLIFFPSTEEFWEFLNSIDPKKSKFLDDIKKLFLEWKKNNFVLHQYMTVDLENFE